MPELPEVETIRTYLESKIQGKTITDIDVREPRQFHGSVEEIRNQKITDVSRKGKILFFHLSNGIYMSIHLKMAGQILFAENKDIARFHNTIPFAETQIMPGKTTRVIVTFDDNSALFYNDFRKFGWFKITDSPHVPKGTDILSPEFTNEFLSATPASQKRAVKIVLTDQDIIAGIGNIYANDSLFLAKIHPTRRANSLSRQEMSKLFQSIQEVIHEAVDKKGSSSKDEVFVAPDSSRGSYQHSFKVYHREGEPCYVCGTKIQRIKQSGRSSYLCPGCQK